ncbi:hypothetical protein [Hyalangium versicolor]|uniref:hypothetical protein n=1 Tax=Hyalangium versicolor TaxID=2861190 RepID=UPI001CCD651B|nr:hypothetical protein [Hyalangium versicolor]
MRTLLLIVLLTVPTLARAQYYEQHRALSLLAGPGAGYTNAIQGDRAKTGPGVFLDLGGSLTVGDDRDELFLLIRGGLGEAGRGAVLISGFRSFFGHDEWQSFFDLSAAVRLFSGTWVGPRIGFGLRRTLSDRLSLYGGLGLSLGFGSGMRVDTEASFGLQWSFPIGSR